MIVRPLTVFERDAVKTFYLALSQDDRRLRFCSMASDATVASYVDRMEFTRATILGAFDPSAHLIGVAELIYGTNEGEMAFAVHADLRNQKIGTSLMERLLIHARMRRTKKAVVMFMSENTPMRRLAVRAGMRVQPDGPECNASMDLQAPLPEEITRWAVEEGFFHSQYFSALMIARYGSLATDSVRAILPCATAPQPLGRAA